MTGNQPHPGMGKSIYGSPAEQISIPAVLSALGVKDTLRLNPFDISAAAMGVTSLLDKKGVRAIIFEAPCIMVSRGGDVCNIESARCTGCGACIKKLGCPAISFEQTAGQGKKLARIDPVLCTGCGICRSVCAFDAIVGGAATGGQGGQA
jgi:indolepyruvate ferredoxin oxidoreductase alpha subunit